MLEGKRDLKSIPPPGVAAAAAAVVVVVAVCGFLMRAREQGREEGEEVKSMPPKGRGRRRR